MDITSVKPAPGAFAHGFRYFCCDCNEFFSVYLKSKPARPIEACPLCGEFNFIYSIDGLLNHCADSDIDPVSFHHSFPHDELIPHSRTGATPRQVEWILGCVQNDKQKNIPVTIESLASQLSYSKAVVEKVFEELHITETGGF
jgi:hypothetical protein